MKAQVRIGGTAQCVDTEGCGMSDTAETISLDLVGGHATTSSSNYIFPKTALLKR